MQLTNIEPSDLGLAPNAWRQYQLDTVERILNSKKRIIILRAPTGSGKSLIAHAIQIALEKRAVILTKSKVLQQQYERDGIVALFGRANYQCNRFPIVTSDKGICHIGQACALQYGGCDYYDQKRLAGAQPICVLNYAYFFLEANGPGKFSRYDWIIADEGHSIPEELAASYSIKIGYVDVRKMGWRVPVNKTIAEWVTWAESHRTTIYKKIRQLKGDPLYEANKVKDIIEKLIAIGPDTANWVIETDKYKSILRPIWTERLANRYFWRHAFKFLIMSATIDPEYLSDQLGMDRSQIEFIDVPSTFPHKNRPILLHARHKVGAKMDHTDHVELVKDIDRILERHNGRGLIHTSNYSLATIIADLSQYPDRILTHNSANRTQIIEQFKTEKNKVLISPSLTEGIDLPYDLCQFQVIAKLPFPFRGDIVWQARFTTNKERADRAYILQTVNAIVQAYGRGMRAPDDNCVTYILDRNFLWLYNIELAHFPSSFQDAIRVTTQL